eukprot:SAG31_NODE_7071_length_1797_cov_1.173145_2_plen_245_part_00
MFAICACIFGHGVAAAPTIGQLRASHGAESPQFVKAREQYQQKQLFLAQCGASEASPSWRHSASPTLVTPSRGSADTDDSDSLPTPARRRSSLTPTLPRAGVSLDSALVREGAGGVAAGARAGSPNTPAAADRMTSVPAGSGVQHDLLGSYDNVICKDMLIRDLKTDGTLDITRDSLQFVSRNDTKLAPGSNAVSIRIPLDHVEHCEGTLPSIAVASEISAADCTRALFMTSWMFSATRSICRY